MLDSHRDLAIPPETGFLTTPEIAQRHLDRQQYAKNIIAFPFGSPSWNDFGLDAGAFLAAVDRLPSDEGLSGVLRVFYAQYAARHGKTRSGDKTPSYLSFMGQVASVLPEAHFIHIVRDGRDVALSWRETWFAPSRDLAGLVANWAAQIRAAREISSSVKYLEVSYERLVQYPEAVLREISAFVDLDYSPDMLAFHQRAPDRLAEHRERLRLNGETIVSRAVRYQAQWRTTLPPQQERIGVWRREMSAEEAAACLGAAGGLLS